MATTSDKFKAAEKQAAHDHFLDPLPVPDATESSTDTAWGLWEHTLRAHEGAAQAAPETDFQETQAVDFQPPDEKP